MHDEFFQKPVINSPYGYPARHWVLDERGLPSGEVAEGRRRAEFITPVPPSKRQKGARTEELFDDPESRYSPIPIINELRTAVDAWRELPEQDWRVTPHTARLLKHWRHHQFSDIRPFFCQVEAVETLIWLTEAAPHLGKRGKTFLDHLAQANKKASEEANKKAGPDLPRLALKLATGAGKTTVMAMIIAWQTINAVRSPNSRKFTRGFLVVTPGLTIKDRLRVLQPNDPNSYYQAREIVPRDMLGDLHKAKIVITNFHVFKQRERLELSRGGRALLQGRQGSDDLPTQESEGEMLQRALPGLMSTKNIMVLNDEAHHCYQKKSGESEEAADLEREERDEAEDNRKAALLWLTGLKSVAARLGVQRVVDLSATPFFISGSGYLEGTLFPWTMSDFSLIDAIECGIVKLPRVPILDDIPGEDMPKFRQLWKHIGPRMPRKGRVKGAHLDPLKIPAELEGALYALYDHYEKTFRLWEKAGCATPPCFIIVCNNTATSKLVYDYVSGFHQERKDGAKQLVQGRLALFRNFDEHGEPFPRPNTLLIDSRQLESGDALDKNFRDMAKDEIDLFRREIIERTGDKHQAENLSEQDLLREVMNTVGKEGRLGGNIRCVVSVSMLTEGWDANTVTHVLGVRAFGTQLLCEQVVGRALRRQSYDLNEEGLFNAEYADVLGVPFDFTAPVVDPPPPPPRETIRVMAIRPERDKLEIRFPHVVGYRVELSDDRLQAKFTKDHVLNLTPDLVAPARTRNAPLIGEGVDLDLVHTNTLRRQTLLYYLAVRLIYRHWLDADGEPKLYLFGQLKRITGQWLDDCLVRSPGVFLAQLMYQEIADLACERISMAITCAEQDKRPVRALLDPYNPEGSTKFVNFTTSKTERWQTNENKCHVNWAVLDSGWEGEFCRVAEAHPRVLAYVKNHHLGLEVPYLFKGHRRSYIPDFIVKVDDGRGWDDPLHLVVEIKGYRGEDAKVKKLTMDTYWIPGVNRLEEYGRWAFAEFTSVFEMEADFAALVEDAFNKMVASAIDSHNGGPAAQ